MLRAIKQTLGATLIELGEILTKENPPTTIPLEPPKKVVIVESGTEIYEGNALDRFLDNYLVPPLLIAGAVVFYGLILPGGGLVILILTPFAA